MIFVTITEDNIDQALTWVKKNCKSYITNDAYVIDIDVVGKPGWITREPRYRFYFNQETDAAIFALRWA